MSSGHTTSSIRRPTDPSRGNTRRTPTGKPADRRDDTRFGDLTRPIPEERQLVKGRGKRGIIALAALVITAALVAALFVLPVKAWLRQGDDLGRKQQELTTLQQANGQLGSEINRLGTKQGIEEAAREEIGYVQRGEIRLTVMPGATAPATMPSGWPYDTLAKIVDVRRHATSG
jgi:cell division protein FtsB